MLNLCHAARAHFSGGTGIGQYMRAGPGRRALFWALLATVIGLSASSVVPDDDDDANAPLETRAALIGHVGRAEFPDALPATLSAVVAFAFFAARSHRTAGSILIHTPDPLHCRSNR
jgi:hypothetical protein